MSFNSNSTSTPTLWSPAAMRGMPPLGTLNTLLPPYAWSRGHGFSQGGAPLASFAHKITPRVQGEFPAAAASTSALMFNPLASQVLQQPFLFGTHIGPFMPPLRPLPMSNMAAGPAALAYPHAGPPMSWYAPNATGCGYMAPPPSLHASIQAEVEPAARGRANKPHGKAKTVVSAPSKVKSTQPRAAQASASVRTTLKRERDLAQPRQPNSSSKMPQSSSSSSSSKKKKKKQKLNKRHKTAALAATFADMESDSDSQSVALRTPTPRQSDRQRHHRSSSSSSGGNSSRLSTGKQPMQSQAQQESDSSSVSDVDDHGVEHNQKEVTACIGTGSRVAPAVVSSMISDRDGRTVEPEWRRQQLSTPVMRPATPTPASPPPVSLTAAEQLEVDRKEHQARVQSLLHNPERTARDIKEAVELLFLLARNKFNDVASRRRLIEALRSGLMSGDGQGEMALEPDAVEEFQLLLLADKMGGDPESTSDLGVRLWKGVTHTADEPPYFKSAHVFETDTWKAFFQQLRRQQLCGKDGRGLHPQHWVERWHRAAKAGHVDAVYRLGQHFFHEREKSKEMHDSAVSWLRRGMGTPELGDKQLECMHNLVLCLGEGETAASASSVKEREALLRRASNHGYGPSCLLRARVLLDHGSDHDRKEVFGLLLKAVNNGTGEALSCLVRLTREYSQDVDSIDAVCITQHLQAVYDEKINDAESMYQWSLCFQHGCRALGIDAPDLVRARARMKRAAMQSHGEAAYQMGIYCCSINKFKQAMQYFALGEASQHVECLFQRGLGFSQGRGVSKCGDTAKSYFDAAVKLGHHLAQYHRGLLHCVGWGSKEADFLAGAERGHPDSIWQLGKWYWATAQLGDTLDSSCDRIAKAVKYLQMAVQQHQHKGAMWDLMRVYQERKGRLHQPDHAQAKELLLQLVKLEDTDALFEVAKGHHHGHAYFTVDLPQALQHYTRAAELGHVAAVYAMKHIYSHGISESDVTAKEHSFAPNPAMALQKQLEAARAGHPTALMELIEAESLTTLPDWTAAVVDTCLRKAAIFDTTDARFGEGEAQLACIYLLFLQAQQANGVDLADSHDVGAVCACEPVHFDEPDEEDERSVVEREEEEEDVHRAEPSPLYQLWFQWLAAVDRLQRAPAVPLLVPSLSTHAKSGYAIGMYLLTHTEYIKEACKAFRYGARFDARCHYMCGILYQQRSDLFDVTIDYRHHFQEGAAQGHVGCIYRWAQLLESDVEALKEELKQAKSAAAAAAAAAEALRQEMAAAAKARCFYPVYVTDCESAHTSRVPSRPSAEETIVEMQHTIAQLEHTVSALYTKGAALGHANCSFHAALRAAVADPSQAATLYTQTIQRCTHSLRLDALHNLGELHLSGRLSSSGSPDRAAAASCFKQAAAAGTHLNSIWQWGCMVRDGFPGPDGVPSNEHACRLFRQGAQGGHVLATYGLGVLLVRDGQGTTSDRREAAELFIRCARACSHGPSMQALHELAIRCRDGERPDLRLAADCLEVAVQYGWEQAVPDVCDLAHRLLHEDTAAAAGGAFRAVSLLAAGEQRDDAASRLTLVMCHQNGHGTRMDAHAAFLLLRKGMAQNQCGCILQLARNIRRALPGDGLDHEASMKVLVAEVRERLLQLCSLSTLPVEQKVECMFELAMMRRHFPDWCDLAQALEGFEAVVEQCSEHRDAWYELGKLYAIGIPGRDMQSDKRKSVDCFRRADALGCTRSSEHLADYYRLVDPHKAAELYEKVALCSPTACYQLASLCLRGGDGFPADAKKGMLYATISVTSKSTCPDTFHLLGMAYYHGQYGVKRDSLRGLQYLHQGAHVQQEQCVESLRTYYVDSTLTVEQLNSIQPHRV